MGEREQADHTLLVRRAVEPPLAGLAGAARVELLDVVPNGQIGIVGHARAANHRRVVLSAVVLRGEQSRPAENCPQPLRRKRGEGDEIARLTVRRRDGSTRTRLSNLARRTACKVTKRAPAGSERRSPHGRNKKINDSTQRTEDLAILDQLNNDYIHSDQFNDVKRFSEILAEDFIVQTPGVTRNLAEFLDFIAKPRPFKDLAVHDVNIRILSDDVALIHGRATYTMLADEVDQEALYTDTYQKRDGTWVCVSACAIAPGT